MMKRAVGCLMIVVIGCDGPAGDPSSIAPHADSTFLRPSVVIGVDTGDPEYMFGAIASVAADESGRVYVGDRIGGTVRVFDPEGNFVRELAREGGGPGEIHGWAADLSFDMDGRLYVRDAARVTVFDRRSEGAVPDSVIARWVPLELGNLSVDRSYLTEDGRYYYPSGLYRRGEAPQFFFLLLEEGDLTGDTLRVPQYPGLSGQRPAILRLGASGGLMLDGVNRVPFAAVPVWSVTSAGGLLSTDGASTLLLETDLAGDTVRTIRLPEPRLRSIPSPERADSLAALEERIAAIPAPPTQVEGLGEGVQARRLPDAPPSVIGLHARGDGLIWVERWPPQDGSGSRYYDVFDSEGALLQVLVLQAPLTRDPPPWFGKHVIAGVVRDPDTGIERVARFDLPVH